jgi:hypothetical protein
MEWGRYIDMIMMLSSLLMERDILRKRYRVVYLKELYLYFTEVLINEPF